MGLSRRFLILFVSVLLLASLPLVAQEIVLKGRVSDPQGNALPEASVQLQRRDQVVAQATSGPDGGFRLKVDSAGRFVVRVDTPGFRPVTHPVTVRASGNSEIQISLGQVASRIENITVTADVNETDVLTPDPAERVFVRQDLLDANPGRPGAPKSRMTAGVNFLIAGGYTGQTTENLFSSEVAEIVGVRIPSYASLTLTYRFGRQTGP